MKSGFTLIELLLALVISSMIAGSLFLVFFQVHHGSLIVQDVMDFDTRFSIINNQLEKDITGIFVPVQAYMVRAISEHGEDLAKQASRTTPRTDQPQTDQKEEIKPLKDVFLGINKGEFLSELTFITNNPVRVYEYADNTIVRPRIVRVYYRLIPDKKKKNTFILTRQEGIELESSLYKPGATKPIKSYELADNIKGIAVSYTTPIIKQKEKEEPLEYEIIKEWREDTLKDTTKKQPKIPYLITMTVALWDNKQEHERTYTFEYPIASFFAELDRVLTPTKSQEPSNTKASEPATVTLSRAGAQSINLPLPSVEEIRRMARQLAAKIDEVKS